MDKSLLEKRIEERAEERFKKELNRFMLMAAENDVGRLLEVTGKDDAEIIIMNDRAGTNSDKVYLKDYFHKRRSETIKEHTNIQEVKEKLIKLYIEEETDEVLKRLESLHYLFE